jgi:hypothetical protein
VQSETARTPAAATSPGRQREARPQLQLAIKTASHANSAASAHHGAIGGPCRGKTSGVTIPRAVVVKVTVAVAGFDPSSVTDDGETAHVAAAGAPVQLQVTI